MPPIAVDVAFEPDPGASYLHAAFTMTSTIDPLIYVDMTSAFNEASDDYIIASGDCIKYDIYWEGASLLIGFDFECSDGTRLKDSGAVDQNGLYAAPALGLLNPYANGSWYHRVIPIPATMIGKTITKLYLACENNTPGTYYARFRDIIVSDGAGSAHAAIWLQSSGIPSLFTTYSAGSGAGPSLGVTLIKEPPIWTDLAPYVLGGEYHRGRPTELDRIDPGGGSVSLDNDARTFDVTNTLGPYSGSLLPQRPIRFRGLFPPNYVANIYPAHGNSGFNNADLLGWTDTSTGGAVLGFLSISPLEGTFSLKGTLAAGASRASFTADDAHVIAWNKNVPLTVSALFKKISGATNSASQIRVICMDVDGNVLATLNPTVAVSGITLATGAFDAPAVTARYGGGIRPSDFPAFTAKLRLEVYVANASGSIVVAVDAIQVEAGLQHEAYVEGGTWYPMFKGKVDRWPPVWHGRHSEVELTLNDGMEQLGRRKIPARFYAQTLSGTQMRAILAASGFDTLADGSDELSKIDAGLSIVQAFTFAEADAPLSRLQDIADAELGLFFVNGDGLPVFQDRAYRIIGAQYASVGTVDDSVLTGDPNYLYIAATPDYSVDRVVNFVSCRPAGATTWMRALDVDSIRNYDYRPQEREPVIVTSNEALDQANYLVSRYKDAEFRLTSLVFDPLRQDGLWPWLLAREISDRFTLMRQPPGGGPGLDDDYYIESVACSFSMQRGEVAPKAEFTFGVSPAQIQTSWWLLGLNSTLGTSTRLAY